MSTRSVRPMADTGSNMSTLTALAPALETQRSRASAIRMAIVTIVYLAIVVAAAIYPLVSPLRDYWNAPVLPLGQAVDIVTGLTWLAVLLISMARQPGGRLWKLIFLVDGDPADRALDIRPQLARVERRAGDRAGRRSRLSSTSWWPSRPATCATGSIDSSSAGRTLWSPPGHSSSSFSWATGATSAATRNASETCSSSGPMTSCTNGFANAIAQSPRSTLIPLVIVAIWRHWRAAGAPPLAGPSCRSSSPFPYGWCWERWRSSAASSTISPASTSSTARPAPSSGGAPPLIFPAGLLLGMLRTRWSRGRIANLVVELGRGVPVGGLRDVLARALGDPTLQLAFAAPSGSGYVDAAGLPVELPLSDPSRIVTRLERDDELLGVLVHDPAIDAEDPGLVEAVGDGRPAGARERAAGSRGPGPARGGPGVADADSRGGRRGTTPGRARSPRGAQQRLVALAMRLQIGKLRSPGGRNCSTRRRPSSRPPSAKSEASRVGSTRPSSPRPASARRSMHSPSGHRSLWSSTSTSSDTIRRWRQRPTSLSPRR